MSATNQFEDNLHLSILGLGVEYPPYRHGPESLETLANRYYKPSTALSKVLSINRFTGIETRASIGQIEHPLVNQPTAPSIKQLDDFFREEGVRLSVEASKKALASSQTLPEDITHVVATTCTNSANPGFDHYVRKKLGIRSTENVLLHGIGCSGGLAAIRTAANLALGASYRKRPARVLVIACEISTPLFRSELDSVDKDQEIRIGVCLFSDGASACVLSNGIGEEEGGSEPVYDILGWKHEMIEDSEEDLGFDVDPLGWKVVLTQRVPALTTATVAPAFKDLVASISSLATLPSSTSADPPNATDFDWALHPGGSTIIMGVQQAMKLTEDHLRATYEIYMNYGNSSSATIMSVLNKLANDGRRENVVACAFGPGISLEMMMLRRKRKEVNGVVETNGTTEANGTAEINGFAETNGTTNGHATKDEVNELPVEDID